MNRHDHHRRDGDPQIRVPCEELGDVRQGWAAWRPVLLGVTACSVALGVYAWLGRPLLPLLVALGVIWVLDALLTREGWQVIPRWALSLIAGVIAYLALWPG